MLLQQVGGRMVWSTLLRYWDFAKVRGSAGGWARLTNDMILEELDCSYLQIVLGRF